VERERVPSMSVQISQKEKWRGWNGRRAIVFHQLDHFQVGWYIKGLVIVQELLLSGIKLVHELEVLTRVIFSRCIFDSVFMEEIISGFLDGLKLWNALLRWFDFSIEVVVMKILLLW
jgi:hypothetical protein